MTVSCVFCGAEAPDDAIFCEACGQKLESPAADSVPTVACPACGTANPPDSAFCEECGGAIPDDAEKGGRKPGFLGLAAKAGAAGIGTGRRRRRTIVGARWWRRRSGDREPEAQPHRERVQQPQAQVQAPLRRAAGRRQRRSATRRAMPHLPPAAPRADLSRAGYTAEQPTAASPTVARSISARPTEGRPAEALPAAHRGRLHQASDRDRAASRRSNLT